MGRLGATDFVDRASGTEGCSTSLVVHIGAARFVIRQTP